MGLGGPWWTESYRIEVPRSSSCQLPVLQLSLSFTFHIWPGKHSSGVLLCFTEERLKEAKQILQAEIAMGLGNQVWRTAKVPVWPGDKG